jgi:hypothetical protein
LYLLPAGRSIQEAIVAIATAPAALTADAIQKALSAQWEADYDPTGPDTPDETLSAIIAKIAAPFVDSAARTIECGGEVWEPLSEGVGPLALWERSATIVEEFTAAGLAFDAELSGAAS